MKQEERDLIQDESAGHNTDTTRSERREAVAADQTDNIEDGTGSNDAKISETGSHQEGQYSKQSDKPAVNK